MTKLVNEWAKHMLDFKQVHNAIFSSLKGLLWIKFSLILCLCYNFSDEIFFFTLVSSFRGEAEKENVMIFLPTTGKWTGGPS